MDARDVADHHLRSHGPVGDDVGDAGVAVLAPHVVDHLSPAAHAEVDVEVWRRDALGIQEPLEEQLEPEGVQVGDPEQVRDETARARAAARAHGYPLLLGPVYEVPDDKEVVEESGLLDDAQLEVEPVHEDAGLRGVCRLLGRPVVDPVALP